jgi:hypothetical protein
LIGSSTRRRGADTKLNAENAVILRARFLKALSWRKRALGTRAPMTLPQVPISVGRPPAQSHLTIDCRATLNTRCDIRRGAGGFCGHRKVVFGIVGSRGAPFGSSAVTGYLAVIMFFIISGFYIARDK